MKETKKLLALVILLPFQANAVSFKTILFLAEALMTVPL